MTRRVRRTTLPHKNAPHRSVSFIETGLFRLAILVPFQEHSFQWNFDSMNRRFPMLCEGACVISTVEIEIAASSIVVKSAGPDKFQGPPHRKITETLRGLAKHVSLRALREPLPKRRIIASKGPFFWRLLQGRIDWGGSRHRHGCGLRTQRRKRRHGGGLGRLVWRSMAWCGSSGARRNFVLAADEDEGQKKSRNQGRRCQRLRAGDHYPRHSHRF